MAERDLATLLAQMAPVPDPIDYVFATAPHETPLPADALMTFREDEALTLVLPADTAGDPHAPRFRRITLTVASDLEAVGFTAAFSRALTAAGIPANVVAAAHHDHVFVPVALAGRALGVLRELSAASR